MRVSRPRPAPAPPSLDHCPCTLLWPIGTGDLPWLSDIAPLVTAASSHAFSLPVTAKKNRVTGGSPAAQTLEPCIVHRLGLALATPKPRVSPTRAPSAVDIYLVAPLPRREIARRIILPFTPRAPRDLSCRSTLSFRSLYFYTPRSPGCDHTVTLVRGAGRPAPEPRTPLLRLTRRSLA